MRAKIGLLCSEKETFQNIKNTFLIEYQIILVCTHMAFYEIFLKQIEVLQQIVRNAQIC